MKALAWAAVGALAPGPGGAAVEATPRPGATPIESADKSVTAKTVGRKSLEERAAMETSPKVKSGCRERRKVSRARRRRQGGAGIRVRASRGRPLQPTPKTINNYLNHLKFYRFAAQFVRG